MKEEMKIKDRDQLIYDLRRFADESLYLNEISKIGANEIINFLLNKLSDPLVTELTTLRSRVKELEDALKEIAEGKGRYNPDKLKHASNTIEDMIELANNALLSPTK